MRRLRNLGFHSRLWRAVWSSGHDLLCQFYLLKHHSLCFRLSSLCLFSLPHAWLSAPVSLPHKFSSCPFGLPVCSYSSPIPLLCLFPDPYLTLSAHGLLAACPMSPSSLCPVSSHSNSLPALVSSVTHAVPSMLPDPVSLRATCPVYL